MKGSTGRYRLAQCLACERVKRKTAWAEKYRETEKRWKAANPDRVRANYERWRDKDPEKRRARCTAYYAAAVADRPLWLMVTRVRARARRSGIEFSITEKDLTMPETCPVLGITMKCEYVGRGKGGARWNSPSLDRIDPALGYVPGNVRVISHRANTLKLNATVQELELVLADLRRLRGG